VEPEPLFRAAALAEYHEAIVWYEARGAGLGTRLADAVEAAIDRIMSSPESFAKSRGEVRDAPVADFPFRIYYKLRTDRVVVLAVYHTARNPKGWTKRIAD
jgi:toxin ParE1/3/4